MAFKKLLWNQIYGDGKTIADRMIHEKATPIDGNMGIVSTVQSNDSN